MRWKKNFSRPSNKLKRGRSNFTRSSSEELASRILGRFNYKRPGVQPNTLCFSSFSDFTVKLKCLLHMKKCIYYKLAKFNCKKQTNVVLTKIKKFCKSGSCRCLSPSHSSVMDSKELYGSQIRFCQTL